MFFYYSHTRPVCRHCFPTCTGKKLTIKRNCLQTRRRNSATGELNHVQLHGVLMTNVQLQDDTKWVIGIDWSWEKPEWSPGPETLSLSFPYARFGREKVYVNLFNVSAGRLSSGNAWILKARTASTEIESKWRNIFARQSLSVFFSSIEVSLSLHTSRASREITRFEVKCNKTSGV